MSKVPIPYMPVQSSMEGRADEKSVNSTGISAVQRSCLRQWISSLIFPWAKTLDFCRGRRRIWTYSDLHGSAQGRKLFVWEWEPAARNWQSLSGTARLCIPGNTSRTGKNPAGASSNEDGSCSQLDGGLWSHSCKCGCGAGQKTGLGL